VSPSIARITRAVRVLSGFGPPPPPPPPSPGPRQGARVGLAGDPIAVGVKRMGVLGWAAVLLEEVLSLGLA
jgi:hypothetical protein